MFISYILSYVATHFFFHMGFDMETRAINQGTVKVCTGRIASAPPDEVGSTYVPQFSPLTESCSVGLWCRAVGNILRTASVVNPNICHISRRIKPELVVSDITSAVSLHSDKRMLMVLACDSAVNYKVRFL